jgi:hypothetical protein
MSFPIYAWLPATVDDPIAWRKAHRGHGRRKEDPREQYKQLPWKSDELIGTEWANIWTGGTDTVAKIAVQDPVHRPDERPSLITHALGSYQFTLGFWCYDQYTIDYSSRIDHLSPQSRLNWMLLSLLYTREKISQYQTEISRMDPVRTSCYTTNLNMKTRSLGWAQKDEARILESIQKQATKHNLQLNLDLLNVGKQGQLALF